MLRFFRTIRKKLIEKYNVRKYLLYAIGEILLVVIGILIALQVNNWNIAREGRATEWRTLELLLKEAENNVAYSKLIIYRAGKLQRDREAAIAKLNGSENVDGDAAHGLAIMTMFRDLTPIHAAHDELTSSGDITFIQSPTVRNAIALFQGVVIFHDRARQDYMAQVPDIIGLAKDYATVRYDSLVPLGYSINVDWSAAAENKALVNAINKVAGDQRSFNVRREIILREAQILCDALGTALQKPCNPPDWIADEKLLEEEK